MRTEVNGPANIILLVELALQSGAIDKDLATKVLRNAELTVQYIKQLENPKGLKWHELVKE